MFEKRIKSVMCAAVLSFFFACASNVMAVQNPPPIEDLVITTDENDAKSDKQTMPKNANVQRNNNSTESKNANEDEQTEQMFDPHTDMRDILQKLKQ